MDKVQYIACDNEECQHVKSGRCSLDTINLRMIRNNGNHIVPLSELSCLNFLKKPKIVTSPQLEFTYR